MRFEPHKAVAVGCNIERCHARIRNSFGSMTRKLSVMVDENSSNRRGTVSRRKPSTASAKSRNLAYRRLWVTFSCMMVAGVVEEDVDAAHRRIGALQRGEQVDGALRVDGLDLLDAGQSGLQV